MKRIYTAIVGGGASGLFCAVNLNPDGEILIFERGERPGRKLSATGNGQGNITNEHVGEVRYFSSEPAALARVDELIARHDEKDMISCLEALGGLFLADERGRVYPAGRQASAVTDLLRYALARKGVGIKTGARVVSLQRGDGGFVVEADTASGREFFFAENAVLCTGGRAAPNFGTDGSAYALARSFGHTVTPLYPSLVQLKTDTTYTKTLKGIRINAVAEAYVGKESVAKVRGDVIFTDYGVSGDAVFRLSAFIADKLSGGDVSLVLDLLPDVSAEKLAAVLSGKAERFPELPESELLCGILNNQAGRAVMKRCKGRNISCVVGTVKRFSLSVTGTLGFDYAQVTKGGVPLSETDENLQSRLVKGLYFAGEVLDADGECGGYNLQWAYSSARAVADAINESRAK